MSDEVLTGRVAISRAGRDKNRAFVIVAEFGEYVMLVDGSLRKLDKPKKKKRKHILLTPQCADDIRPRLIEGKHVLDTEIRGNLLALGFEAE